jgi:release factor glutamine methyltransferase
MRGTFFGLPFTLAPGRVFSPRPATELLVRAALRQIDCGPRRVADVGTGSGAIAVTLAAHRPQLQVWATDTNPDSVELARKNAVENGVAERVRVLRSELLEGVPDRLDAVVANLPYLPTSLRDARYDTEPADAVYAPDDGLDPLRRLLAECRERLASRGRLLIQFDREVLAANWWQLEHLRATLEHRRKEAA